MAGFAVEPDQLYGAGRQHGSVRPQLAPIYLRTVAGRAAAGNFCGGDRPGQVFARSYVPNATDLLHRIDTTHQGIGSSSDKIAWWAAACPAIDQWLAPAMRTG